MLNKKGLSGFWIVIIIIVFLLITSTQKIAINDKQIATASYASCGLIKQSYDTIKRICIQNEKNQTVS